MDPSDVSPLFGATTDVNLVTSEPRTMLAVPLGAVQTDSTGEYVMRLASNGNAERVPVTSDSVQGDVVAITGDLKAGDQAQVFSTTSNSSNNGGFGGGPGGLIP
jgi:multidrug efflux pump subunit AcrA (membrane-fusion protein)